MRLESLFVLTLTGFFCFFVPERNPFAYCLTVQADDENSEAARITATEPAALVCGSKVTFKVRGFNLREAMELRFPAAAETKVKIIESKDAPQPNGLENKRVGDTQLVAELTLPADLSTGLLEYMIVTPSGEATGKILVLSADCVIDEREPNDGFREAQELRPGLFVRGSIQKDRDVDVYAFTAQAGQQIKVTVTSGGPLLMDAQLHCYDSRGQFLAAANDDQSHNPVLTLKPQMDGTVFLCVSSAHDIGGEWHSYLLTVEEVK